MSSISLRRHAVNCPAEMSANPVVGPVKVCVQGFGPKISSPYTTPRSVIFMQDNYTKQHREATGALLKCFVDEMVDGIATSRKLDRQAVGTPHHCLQFNRQETIRPDWQCLLCAAGQKGH